MDTTHPNAAKALFNTQEQVTISLSMIKYVLFHIFNVPCMQIPLRTNVILSFLWSLPLVTELKMYIELIEFQQTYFDVLYCTSSLCSTTLII